MSGDPTRGGRSKDSSDEALGATLPLDAPIPSPPPVPPPIASGSRSPPLAGVPGGSDAGAGNFQVETELARGGIGRVLIARDRRLERPVAIKELIELREDALRRFEREARITAGLQHPGIVGVHEAGRWPDGRPYYAMELVQGRSLADVVAAAGTLEERLALVPRVLVVAEALAYAHSRRVIHRDLKPANVLCGDFGETVVIDWGLAKELGEEPDLQASGPLISRDGETVVGTVLGTPAYMPPEQAAGDAVDQRADVYAIGAILYHVLAGKTPYHDAPGSEVLARVRIGPPAPIAELAPGCPPDLRDVVDKAMARDPAARYPSARELADDLLRFQTGQLVAAHRYGAGERLRRFVGRHRGALAVAAVLLAVLAGTSIYGVRRIMAERDQATRHREAAERRRAAAEDLIEFMVGDLRARLEPVGKLDALAGVGGAVESYYAELAAEAELGPRELDRRGGALRLLASARRNTGDLDGARTALREALAMARRSHPEGDHPSLASALEGIGAIEEDAGDGVAALAAFREALAIRARLAADDADSRLLLARSHDLVGEQLAKRGDLNGALAEHRSSRDLIAAIVRVHPDDGDAARRLFRSHLHLGDMLRARGEMPDALAAYRSGVELAERWSTRASDDVRWRASLRLGLGRLGNAQIESGERAAALPTLQRALAVAEKIARDDPGNRSLEANIAMDLVHIGDVHRMARRWSDALPPFRRAAAIYDSLTALDPANQTWQRDGAGVHGRVGVALLGLGDSAGALVEQRRAMTAIQALVDRDPGNTVWLRDLSVRHDNIGKVLVKRGDIDGGLASYRESLRIAERLAAANPTSAKLADDVITGHHVLAAVMFDHRRDRAQALVHAERALTELERMAAGKPTDADRDTRLATLRELRGSLRAARW